MNCAIFHTNFRKIVTRLHFNCLQLQLHLKYPHKQCPNWILYFTLTQTITDRSCNIETKSQNDKNLFALMAENKAAASQWFYALSHVFIRNFWWCVAMWSAITDSHSIQFAGASVERKEFWLLLFPSAIENKWFCHCNNAKLMLFFPLAAAAETSINDTLFQEYYKISDRFLLEDCFTAFHSEKKIV